MKKIYSILGLCALFALPTFAQEEDMTSYISNPGFDQDLTWQADGTMKEIVDKSEVLSSRSRAYVAADGTVYCYADASVSSNWNASKRANDQWATNGFVAQIQGWTIETNKATSAPYKSSSPEWVYFGSIAYGLGERAIPVADDGDTYVVAPAKPAECDTEDNLGFAYLRAGWGGKAVYKQVVQLPCAQYRLEYWIYNANYAGSANNTNCKNLCKVTCRDDVFVDEEGFNTQEWTKHTIEFTPTADFTIEFGFESSGGSGSNPFVCIDGIKLYKIGEADREQLLQSDIMKYIDQINAYAEDNLADYSGVFEDIQGKMEEYFDVTTEGDLEAMQSTFNEVKAYYENLPSILEKVTALNNLIETAAELLESEEIYPGAEALQTELESAQETISGGKIADVEAGVTKMEQAVKDYYMSQEASPEKPANFTFYIDNPTFAAQGKWYIGETGGDQSIKTDKTDNEGNSINCWNAWRNTMEIGNSVSINQDLVGLRNGKYTLTADINTQDGCITNQHIFANSTVDNADSPVMTVTGWSPCVWETLTTGVVIVTDGKLTVGAIGVSDGDTPSNHGGTDTDKRRGWFNLTNVKLNYLGEATDAEVAAVIAKKYENAEALAASMHFAADKAAFTEAIATAKAANDFDALNTAIATAKASETEYNNIMNGSYKDLKDRMAGSVEGVTYSDNAKKITKVVIDAMDAYIASADATAENAQNLTSIQRIYRDTLIPALTAAEDKAAEVTNAEGKAALEGTIASVVSKLSTYTTDEDYINECVAALNNAISVATAADIAYADNTDVTAYMTNPTVDSETGWTFVKVVGNTNIAKGQQYNGDAAGGYIDSWNGAGGTRHTGYQVLNVPNGKYKVENIMRTSGTGAYLFASDKAPVTSEDGVVTLDATATSAFAEAKIVPTPAKYFVVPEGEEADENKTDAYGEIWMAAADKVMAKFGISGADNTNSVSIYDLVVDANNGSTDCPEGVDAADWAVFSANAGKGRGWFNNSLEIEVKDHTLVVGASCDYVFANKTEAEAFAGTWFSADNFKLTLVKAGDNTGWNPATTVEAVETSAQPTAVYSISGTRVNGLQKGINIVKMSNGVVKKVLVK